MGHIYNLIKSKRSWEEEDQDSIYEVNYVGYRREWP